MASHPAAFLMQHALNFFPLPQGQGSLRPTLGPVWRMGSEAAGTAAGAASAAIPRPTRSGAGADFERLETSS